MIFVKNWVVFAPGNAVGLICRYKKSRSKPALPGENALLLDAHFQLLHLDVLALFADDGFGAAIAFADRFLKALVHLNSAQNTRLLHLAVEAA